MLIIDGMKISHDIKKEIKQEVEHLKSKGIFPCLAVILIGDDPASAVYVKNKKKACDITGIISQSFELPKETPEEEILQLIKQLNINPDVHGILVQLPVPKGIDAKKIIQAISPQKDVDGFHPLNAGALSIGDEGFVSCTPAGILELLKRTDIETEGRHCVVVGRSNIVGKPAAALMLGENATVTVCHSKTRDLAGICRSADILIAAAGAAKMITADMVKEGAVVIDVGMNRDENGKLCGDVDFESVKERAGAITPVPGGVGPMTIAMLMRNCLLAAKKYKQQILNGKEA